MNFIGPAYLKIFYDTSYIDSVPFYTPRPDMPKVSWDTLETLYMEVKAHKARYLKSYGRPPVGEPQAGRGKFVSKGRESASRLGIAWTEVVPPKDKQEGEDKRNKRKADDVDDPADHTKRQKTTHSTTDDITTEGEGAKVGGSVGEAPADDVVAAATEIRSASVEE